MTTVKRLDMKKNLSDLKEKNSIISQVISDVDDCEPFMSMSNQIEQS